MERGPLPPHERTWRHPSELAAEERAVVRAQAAAPSTRVFALTTGTVGLLAVGILILTVTPHRQESPIAISASTTPAPVRATDASSPRATVEGSTTSRPVVLAARSPVTTAFVSPRAVATPIGDGRMALIIGDSVEDQATINVEVRLPSGRTGTARIVDRSGDVWLIELHQAEPGHAIAAGRPAGSEIVTVMATPPVTVAFADISKLDIHEGTAVLDADGNLVGICTRRRGDGSVRLLDVRADLVDATIVDP